MRQSLVALALAHHYGFTSAIVIGAVGIHNSQQDCF